MRRVFAGIGSAVIASLISFILFRLIKQHGYQEDVIQDGIFIVTLYGLPFIVVGAVVTNFILVKRDWYGFVVNTVAGALIAIVVVMLFRFYKSTDMTVFIICTCIIGAISNYMGWKTTKTSISRMLAFVTPVLLVLYFLI